MLYQRSHGQNKNWGSWKKFGNLTVYYYLGSLLWCSLISAFCKILGDENFNRHILIDFSCLKVY